MIVKDHKTLAHLCFWLPVGRSVFGFQGSEDEPLAVQQNEKEEGFASFERNITSRVQHVVSQLEGYGKITFSPELGGRADRLGRRYIIIPVKKNVDGAFDDFII